MPMNIYTGRTVGGQGRKWPLSEKLDRHKQGGEDPCLEKAGEKGCREGIRSAANEVAGKPERKPEENDGVDHQQQKRSLSIEYEGARHRNRSDQKPGKQGQGGIDPEAGARAQESF